MGFARGPLTMRAKIMLSSIVCMLSALLLQTFLFYRSSSQVIYGQTQEININTMQNLQDEMYSFNKAIENSLIKIYNQIDFMHDLAAGETADQLQRTYGLAAYDLTQNEFTPSQNVTSLYIYSAQHELISLYRHAQTPIYQYPENIYDAREGFDGQLIPSYVDSSERVMLITSYYNPYRGVQLVRYVLKIYRDSAEPMGYLVCDVDPKPFVRLMEKYRYSESQIIWIQPTGGEVAVSTEQSDAPDAPFGAATLAIAGGGVPDDAAAGSGYELFSATERKYNFCVYSLIPQTLLRLNQRALLSSSMVVAVLIILAFTALFLLVSRELTKPLTYMVNTMQRIKRGDTKLRLKPMKLDEIGILGREFNEMLNETERLLTQELETQIMLNDAKYKALQAQVNPHFLYNTLDTMGGIANAQHCGEVATLCRALSNLFRYSLDMQQPLATLEQEILHIKNYMYVMNVRMQDALQLRIEVPYELLQARVPRLSIQPLVENAVQHGLRDKRGEKRIAIGAALLDGGRLAVWVEDNGVGMDAAALNLYLQNSVNAALHKKSSIGVDNINARAKLLYGEAYGVTVQSEVGIGSRVTLVVPLERESDTNGQGWQAYDISRGR